MNKYNLYDSLEMLDFIKKDHNVDSVKKFKFTNDEGFAAIFDIRLDNGNGYTLKKGVIKNQMICYREVDCYNDEVFANYKIVYGNINETYEVDVENEDLENIYKVVKSHLLGSDNIISKDDFDMINTEIIETALSNFYSNKIEKDKVYKKVK